MDNFTYAVVKNTPEKIAELHETLNSVELQRNMMAICVAQEKRNK